MQTEDDDPIDFSALDPSRNQLKWERFVQATMSRAIPQPDPMWLSLATRGRMLLGFAAVVALLAWVPAFFTPAESPASELSTLDTAGALADWAARGDVPDSVNLFDALGAHAR